MCGMWQIGKGTGTTMADMAASRKQNIRSSWENRERSRKQSSGLDQSGTQGGYRANLWHLPKRSTPTFLFMSSLLLMHLLAVNAFWHPVFRNMARSSDWSSELGNKRRWALETSLTIWKQRQEVVNMQTLKTNPEWAEGKKQGGKGCDFHWIKGSKCKPRFK